MCFKRNKQDCSVSFRVFDQMIDCIGTAFSECGIMGKTVAVIGETTPEWVMTYLATVNGGGVIVPLDKELAPEEIANFLSPSGCLRRCIFTQLPQNISGHRRDHAGNQAFRRNFQRDLSVPARTQR